MVTCADIKNMQLAGVTLCAGEGGLDRPILWTYIKTESPEQAPPQRGDLILAVIDYKTLDFQKAIRLLEEYDDVGISGIIFSVIHDKDPLPEALLDRADSLDLPVFISDWSNSFSSLSHTIGEFIATSGRHDNSGNAFLYDLLFGYNINPQYIFSNGRRYGIEFGKPYRVGIIVVDRVYSGDIAQDNLTYRIYVSQMEEQVHRYGVGTLFLEFMNKCVLLLSDETAQINAVDQLLQNQDNDQKFIGKIQSTCILGRAYTKPEDFSKSYHEAKRFISKREQFPNPKNKKVISTKMLGMYQFLFNSNVGDAAVQEYCVDRLNPLLEYDHSNGTDLVGSLLEYYMCGFNMSRTSEKLYIHRNTLQYRLNKITELLGVELDDYIDILDVINCILIQKIIS